MDSHSGPRKSHAATVFARSRWPENRPQARQAHGITIHALTSTASHCAHQSPNGTASTQSMTASSIAIAKQAYTHGGVK